jgi:antitoxin component of MazEF toxin-antitoxin module
MTITITQKVIKIGTSKGVTIPAKDLRVLGIETGSSVKITIEPVVDISPENKKLQEEYQEFVAQYGETLKNLRDR